MPARRCHPPAEVMSGNAEGSFVVEQVQGPWHLQGWVEIRDGAPVLTELRVRPAGGRNLNAAHAGKGPATNYPHEDGRRVPPGGITTKSLRSFHLRHLTDEAIRIDDTSVVLLPLFGIDPEEGRRRPGRRGRDDLFYAQWAERYLGVCERTRQPYPQLAAESHYSERSIRDFVHKARQRGLLVGGSKGRAGGRLSSKAERLLDRLRGEGQ